MTRAANPVGHVEWRATIEASLTRIRQQRQQLFAEARRILDEQRRIVLECRVLVADARAMRLAAAEHRLTPSRR